MYFALPIKKLNEAEVFKSVGNAFSHYNQMVQSDKPGQSAEKWFENATNLSSNGDKYPDFPSINEYEVKSIGGSVFNAICHNSTLPVAKEKDDKFLVYINYNKDTFTVSTLCFAHLSLINDDESIGCRKSSSKYVEGSKGNIKITDRIVYRSDNPVKMYEDYKSQPDNTIINKCSLILPPIYDINESWCTFYDRIETANGYNKTYNVYLYKE